MWPLVALIAILLAALIAVGYLFADDPSMEPLKTLLISTLSAVLMGTLIKLGFGKKEAEDGSEGEDENAGRRSRHGSREARRPLRRSTTSNPQRGRRTSNRRDAHECRSEGRGEEVPDSDTDDANLVD